jgi:hypothetical protein
MTVEVRVKKVRFDELSKGSQFLLVTKEGNTYCLGTTVYQKHTWQGFNAVRENHDGKSCNQGWTTFEDNQLVLPLQ